MFFVISSKIRFLFKKKLSVQKSKIYVQFQAFLFNRKSWILFLRNWIILGNMLQQSLTGMDMQTNVGA